MQNESQNLDKEENDSYKNVNRMTHLL